MRFGVTVLFRPYARAVRGRFVHGLIGRNHPGMRRESGEATPLERTWRAGGGRRRRPVSGRRCRRTRTAVASAGAPSGNPPACGRRPPTLQVPSGPPASAPPLEEGGAGEL